MQSLKNSMPSKKSIYMTKPATELSLLGNTDEHHKSIKPSFTSSSHAITHSIGPGSDVQSSDYNFSSQNSLLNSNPSSSSTSPPPISDSHQSNFQPKHSADKYKLSNYGLPLVWIRYYSKKGVKTLFDWQVECLHTPGVLEGKNLIFSAPTSAGKTIVADILMLRTVLTRRKKAIIILPFVSVSREKMMALQSSLYGEAKIGGFMGSNHTVGGLDQVDIAVCTIEKAYNFVNRLIEEKKLYQIGAIIVDELHMLGDYSRGYLLELLLTKLVYITQTRKNSIQIIGMSATLPNLNDVATWLNAELYITQFRPVPLEEKIKIGNEIFTAPSLSDKHSAPVFDLGFVIPHEILHLVLETVLEGSGVLIFCSTKNLCEKLATNVAVMFDKILAEKNINDENSHLYKKIAQVIDTNSCKSLLNQIYISQPSAEAHFKAIVPFGVSFHHAGLSIEERDIIEDGFRQGILKVLIATSTLSSGVNLPARRVIVASPMFGNHMMDVLTYKQMAGRAGRQGIDSRGESILCCTVKERDIGIQLVSGSLREVKSSLYEDVDKETVSQTLQKGILDGIASRMTETEDKIIQLVHSSFACSRRKLNDDSIKACIDFLVQNNFIYPDASDSKNFFPSKLGKAVLASSISPNDALYFVKDLQQARKAFVLDNDLHILFEITLCFADRHKVDWNKYLEIFDELEPEISHTAKVIGINPKYILDRTISDKWTRDKNYRIHVRFYYALALNDLIKEHPLHKVSLKYNIPKGELQNIQTYAATFAGIIAIFCKNIGYDNLELIISQYRDRLQFGVKRELIDLLRLSALSADFARCLYQAGVSTLIQVAHAKPQSIEKILLMATKFQHGVNPSLIKVWNPTLGLSLTIKEIAEHTIKEARSIVERDIGGKIAWSSGESGEEQDEPEGQQLMKDISRLKQRRSKKRKLSSSPRVWPTKKDKTSISKELVKKSINSKKMITRTVSKAIILPKASSTPGPSSFTTKVYDVPELSVPSHIPANPVNYDQIESKQELIEQNPSDSSHHINSKTFEVNTHLNEPSENLESFESIDQALQSGPSSKTSSMEEVRGNNQESPLSDDRPCTPMRAALDTSDSSPAKRPKTSSTDKKPPVIRVARLLNSARTARRELFTENNSENVSPLKDDQAVVNIDNDILLQEVFQELENRGKILCFQARLEYLKRRDYDIGAAFSEDSQTKLFKKGLPMVYSRSCCLKKVAIYFGFTVYRIKGQEMLQKFAIAIKNFIERTDLVKIIVYDLYPIFKVFRLCFNISKNVILRKINWFDLKIAKWMLDPDAKESLNCRELLLDGYALPSDSNIIREDTCWCAFNSLRAYKILNKELEKIHLLRYLEKMDMKVISIISQSEIVGLPIDRKYLEEFKANCQELHRSMRQKAYSYAGEKIDLESPWEVSRVLFLKLNLLSHCDHLKEQEICLLKSNKRCKLPDHLKSNKKILNRLRSYHEFPCLILMIRKLKKTMEFADSYLKFIGNMDNKNLRICGVSTNWTSTGRIIMDNPNLQQVPKPFVVEYENKNIDINLRKAFKARQGYSLVAADYCQLELRILAYFSKDTLLMEAINSSDDIFKSIAARLYQKGICDVTDEERSYAKMVCYGIIYGMGKVELANRLGSTQEFADELKKKFFSTYHKLNQYIFNCKQEALEKGGIETVFKRHRLFKVYSDSPSKEKASVERKAINSTIQGSAADLIRHALILVDKTKEERNVDAEFLLQMHDELIFEVQNSSLDKFCKIVKRCMEHSANNLKLIQFPVKINVGPDWGSLKEFPVKLSTD